MDEFFTLDLEEHKDELVYDRITKLFDLSIQGMEGEIGELIDDLLLMELKLQASRLRLQVADVEEYLKDKLVQHKRSNIKKIKD